MKKSPKPKKKAAPAKAAPTRAPIKAAKAAPKSARAPRPVASKVAPRRADYGAPIDGFFAKQAPAQRAILETLRKLIEEEVPDATAAIKWGMPFYTLDGEMMCALGGFKSHVNLILPGPPGTYADPGGLLESEGKTGRHLKVRTTSEVPLDATRAWLRRAAEFARARQKGATS